MEFPEERGSQEAMHDPEALPKHIMESPVSVRSMTEDRVHGNEAVPMPMAQPLDRVAGDVISLESMRGAIVTNFEQDDLDVPAFLRKRNDVM